MLRVAVDVVRTYAPFTYGKLSTGKNGCERVPDSGIDAFVRSVSRPGSCEN